MSNSLNLQEIDQEQALSLNKFFIKAEKNLFLFGRKGTGKTEIAMQAARECNYKINYINLSVIERPDLAGYPDLASDGDIVTFKSPYFLPKLKDKDKPDSIILFDEVDKASPEVTAPLLEILQFKKINGERVNAASCILTGNLINELTHSNSISTALLDRGAKYVLVFDFNHWYNWAKENNVHDLILGFLNTNQDLACGKVDDVTYASASPRAWTMASDALFKANELSMHNIDVISRIISGFVGSEVGLKFKIWYEHYRKFEPIVSAIIDGKEYNFNFNSLMSTEKIIFIISLCFYAKSKTIQTMNFVYLDNLINFIKNVEYEIQLVGLCNSFTLQNIMKYKLYDCKLFFDYFEKVSGQFK